MVTGISRSIRCRWRSYGNFRSPSLFERQSSRRARGPEERRVSTDDPGFAGDRWRREGDHSTYKVKNIRRDPRITLLVYGDKFNGSNYIQIDGKAEVIEHPRAMDIVLDWHRKIRGVPDNWDDIRKKTLSERRIAIRVTIERAGPQSRG